MKTNRRGFLGFLGVGAVSAPLAAKAAAEAEISRLTALRGVNVLASGIPSAAGQGTPAQVGEYISPYIKAHGYLKTWGKLPSFVEDHIWERAKTVHYLDPDIACKRSWSLNAKIHEQRQRNFKWEVEKYTHTGKYEIAQSAFKKITGFEWPW